MTSSARTQAHAGARVILGDRAFKSAANVDLTDDGSGAVTGHITLPADGHELSDLDLTAEISVEAGGGDGVERVFTGVVEAATVAVGQIHFDVAGPIAVLHEARMRTALGFANVPTPEIISYVLTASGVPQGRQSIDGFQPGGPKTLYVCIFPVEGLLVAGSLAVGPVTFYGQDATTERDVELAETADRLPWAVLTFDARARTAVLATDFVRAEADARQKVQKALEWISFRLRHSEAVPVDISGDDSITWDRARALRVPTLTDQFYAYRYTTASTVSGSWSSDRSRPDADPLSSATSSTDFGRFFPSVVNETLRNGSEPSDAASVSEALHWLHRSDRAPRDIDKLLDLWTSLEFLVASLPIRRMFTKSERSRIRNALAPQWEDDARWPVLRDKLNQLNAVPVRVVLEEFCSDQQVPMSAADHEIIRRTRQIRNDVVHGRRRSPPSKDDNRRLRFVITKVLFRRLAMVNRQLSDSRAQSDHDEQVLPTQR